MKSEQETSEVSPETSSAPLAWRSGHGNRVGLSPEGVCRVFFVVPIWECGRVTASCDRRGGDKEVAP